MITARRKMPSSCRSGGGTRGRVGCIGKRMLGVMGEGDGAARRERSSSMVYARRPPLRLKWAATAEAGATPKDRKSTRLNSSHLVISYAVFCLKKKIITLAKYSH